MQQRRISQSSLASLSDDSSQGVSEGMNTPQCQRIGIMAAFASMMDFENNFENLMVRFSSPPGSPHLSDMSYSEMMKVKIGDFIFVSHTFICSSFFLMLLIEWC